MIQEYFQNIFKNIFQYFFKFFQCFLFFWGVMGGPMGGGEGGLGGFLETPQPSCETPQSSCETPQSSCETPQSSCGTSQPRLCTIMKPIKFHPLKIIVPPKNVKFCADSHSTTPEATGRKSQGKEATFPGVEGIPSRHPNFNPS